MPPVNTKLYEIGGIVPSLRATGGTASYIATFTVPADYDNTANASLSTNPYFLQPSFAVNSFVASASPGDVWSTTWELEPANNASHNSQYRVASSFNNNYAFDTPLSTWTTQNPWAITAGTVLTLKFTIDAAQEPGVSVLCLNLSC